MPQQTARDLLHGRPIPRRALLLSFILVAVVAALYVTRPAGIGRTALSFTVVPLVFMTAFGPLVRGARPLRIWLLVTFGVLFLLMGLLSRTYGLSGGQFRATEAFYVVGYLFLSAWLWGVSVHLGTGRTPQVLLDASAATAGTFLALWSIAGVLGQTRNASALVWALYPVLDSLALALAAHLAFRLRPPVRAWRWVVGAIVLQLVIDTVYFVLGLVSVTGPTRGYSGLYLFTYWALAIAGAHATIVDVTRERRSPDAERLGRLRHAPMVLGVVPALAVLAVPIDGPVDRVVRSALIAVLILCLFTRLTLTMGALAKAESSSRHRSLHDPLTGLLNRAGLFDALEHRLDRDAAADRSTALLFLDCDDFKNVNDTWGHPAGDTLLCAIAAGLPRRLRPDDIVARHGGDEFVVVASLDDPDDAPRVAENALAFFTTPLPVLGERTHKMTPSIGVAVAAPHENRSAVELLEMADVALYEAKNRGRAQYATYDAELDARARYRAAVFDALRTTVAEGDIAVHFQPILTGPHYDRLVGWEALARWNDPGLGEVAPSVFIPLAEQHRLIDALGASVLRRACLDLAELRAALGLGDVIVSVNVSAAQLKRPHFADVVADALASAGLPGNALWLEVTETSLLETNATVLNTIRRIQDTGVSVCLDDFGTGYSPLDLFLHQSVDVVKLDKTLVQRLDDEPLARQQLRALLDLLDTLQVETVVAEGIETPGQAAAVAAIGCPMVQGWHFGHAMPVAALLAEGALPTAGFPSGYPAGLRP